MFDLSGKVALITGSSRGIGLAIAQRMAQFGARVVVSSRTAEACAAAAAAIRADRACRLDIRQGTFSFAMRRSIRISVRSRRLPTINSTRSCRAMFAATFGCAYGRSADGGAQRRERDRDFEHRRVRRQHVARRVQYLEGR